MTLPLLVHFVGIGGIGMSALARILLDEGRRVSGSDLQENSFTQELARRGATIYRGHQPDHVAGAELVVITAAAREDNPEVQEARRRGIAVLKRAELLGQMMRYTRGIAVAGTHGKTTTSSLIGYTLVEAGLDPTVIVGGDVPELGGNARSGAGDLLVAEADEFDASFLTLKPSVAVVTNVEPEHLDFYKDFQGVIKAFSMFLLGVPASGHIIFCLDDPVLAALQSNERGSNRPKLNVRSTPAFAQERSLLTDALQAQSISYGFHPQACWRAERLQPNARGGTDFTVLKQHAAFGDFSLRIPGRHNVSNALAVVAVGDLLGVPLATLQRAIAAFNGVKRRFQVLGEADGVTVVDDYGHHPTEVAATLAAARARYANRPIHCIFQPHTYSRTKLLLAEFASAFRDADRVSVTDIYAAREDNIWGITGRDLAVALDHPSVNYTATLEQAAGAALATLKSGDVLIVMGAGDVYKAGERVLEGLRARC